MASLWNRDDLTLSKDVESSSDGAIATPIDDDIRAARERFQKRLDKDAAEAEKLRKEEEERKRQERLEELKTGPKSRKDVKGRDYNPLMANSEGMGGGGGRIGRVKPCPPGG